MARGDGVIRRRRLLRAAVVGGMGLRAGWPGRDDGAGTARPATTAVPVATPTADVQTTPRPPAR